MSPLRRAASVLGGVFRNPELRRVELAFAGFNSAEWGAGYAYPRLASVTATSPLRLLVFPEGSLKELVERYPAIADLIREAAAERLPRHS